MTSQTLTLTNRLPPKLSQLFKPSRYKILYGGRGGAKSWGVARVLLMLGATKQMRILCTREIQNSIDDSVHRLLCDQIRELGLGWFYEPKQKSITAQNGTEFLFAGLRQQDVGKIKSLEGVDICWVEEAEAVTKKSWDILTPTIRKAGSEIWVTFNPQVEEDETYQRFVVAPPKDSIVIEINWRDNPWFPDTTLPQERDDTKARDPDGYANIWEGKPRTIVAGAIFSTELHAARDEGRICQVPYDPALPVHTFWDLGVGDATAIWFAQAIASEIRLVDYHEDEGEGLPYYADILAQKSYTYGKHWAPHDIEVREFGSGRSRIEVARSLGINFKMVPRAGSGNAESREERIHASRMIFPRCWFDAERTKAGIKALSNYRRDFNERLDEFKPTPVHDWASHGADAFGHMAVSLRTEPEVRPAYRPPSIGAGGWMR